jgi:hypothetical protein
LVSQVKTRGVVKHFNLFLSRVLISSNRQPFVRISVLLFAACFMLTWLHIQYKRVVLRGPQIIVVIKSEHEPSNGSATSITTPAGPEGLAGEVGATEVKISAAVVAADSEETADAPVQDMYASEISSPVSTTPGVQHDFVFANMPSRVDSNQSFEEDVDGIVADVGLVFTGEDAGAEAEKVRKDEVAAAAAKEADPVEAKHLEAEYKAATEATAAAAAGNERFIMDAQATRIHSQSIWRGKSARNRTNTLKDAAASAEQAKRQETAIEAAEDAAAANVVVSCLEMVQKSAEEEAAFVQSEAGRLAVDSNDETVTVAADSEETADAPVQDMYAREISSPVSTTPGVQHDFVFANTPSRVDSDQSFEDDVDDTDLSSSAVSLLSAFRDTLAKSKAISEGPKIMGVITSSPSGRPHSPGSVRRLELLSFTLSQAYSS